MCFDSSSCNVINKSHGINNNAGLFLKETWGNHYVNEIIDDVQLEAFI